MILRSKQKKKKRSCVVLFFHEHNNLTQVTHAGVLSLSRMHWNTAPAVTMFVCECVCVHSYYGLPSAVVVLFSSENG